ncbi:MAG: helix-turn-helix transcriptional regulator [Alphaproteobacteria bacterium]|nr:helix-turn-helix transcriptional regulator [Alphaproteobacteria bacterium]
MKTKTILPNRVKEICDERGISVRELSRLAKISSSEMGRIVSGKEQLTLKQTMTICGILNVNSYEIFDIKFPKKFTSGFDDVLLGSITIWLSEASSRFKVKLTKPEYTRWTTFIYKESLSQNLPAPKTQSLTTTVIKILEIAQKKK